MTESVIGTWTALVASLRALPVAARVWVVTGTAALVVALGVVLNRRVKWFRGSTGGFHCPQRGFQHH